jgi:pilus assembly protein CpaE
MQQPQVIVSAMRAGAREFIERPTTTTDLLEAFVRLTTAQRKVRREGTRGKVFTVVNAKGGSGATTVAVNLALALQESHGNVALIDLAQLGHAALHLNVKPLFTVADALRNLHRLDSSLLESFMTRHADGLQLLAGANMPAPVEPSTAEFARLFDMMVNHFRYVVVDSSSRLDGTTRLVCNLSETVLLVGHTDVASLWSAARVLQYLGETGGRERVRLVLNRFRKIPGFTEADAEAAAGAKLLWKIPNNYFAVSTAIDRGNPLMQQNHTEIARSFAGLAAALTQNDLEVKRTTWSLFKTV